MANEKRTAELSLLAKVDQQTVERSIKRLRDLRVEEQRRLAVTQDGAQADRAAAQSIGAVGRETNQYINSIRQRIAIARLDVDAQQRQLAALRDEKEARESVTVAAERQAASASRAASAGGGGRSQSRFEASGDVSTGLSAAAALLPGGAGNTVRGLADLSGLVEQLPRLTSGLAGLTGAATAAEGATVAVGVGLGTVAAAAALAIPAIIAVALAIKKFQGQIDDAKKALDVAVDNQVEYYRLIQTGTEESIRAEIERIEIEREANQRALHDLQAASEQAGIFGKIITTIFPAARKKAEELEEAIAGFNSQLDPLQRALGSEEVQARSAAEAAKEQADKLAESTAATKTATSAERERTGVIQQATQALSFSQQIAQQVIARQKQEADLARQNAERFAAFQDARNKAIADGELAQLNIIRDAKRDQAAAFRRSEHEIAKIRIRAAQGEFEALLTLDFAGAARIRREAANTIGEARFDTQFEAAERLIQTQLRLEDARTATEQQLLDIAKDRARFEIEAARAMADIVRQAIQQMVATIPTLTGLRYAPSITSRANGGSLAAGQPSWVNERPGQRESFNGSMFPPGVGLFIPKQSGTVQSGGGGISVAVNMAGMTFNDRREIARVAGQRVEQEISRILDN